MERLPRVGGYSSSQAISAQADSRTVSSEVETEPLSPGLQVNASRTNGGKIPEKQPGMNPIGWQTNDFTFPQRLSARNFLRIPAHTSG